MARNYGALAHVMAAVIITVTGYYFITFREVSSNYIVCRWLKGSLFIPKLIDIITRS